MTKNTPTPDLIERAAQLAEEINKWAGEPAINKFHLMNLVWALGHDEDLHEELNALIKKEREEFEQEMEREVQEFEVTLRRTIVQETKFKTKANNQFEAEGRIYTQREGEWKQAECGVIHVHEVKEVEQQFAIVLELENPKEEGWLTKDGELGTLFDAAVFTEEELEGTLPHVDWNRVKRVIVHGSPNGEV